MRQFDCMLTYLVQVRRRTVGGSSCRLDRNRRDLAGALCCAFKQKVARGHSTCSGKGTTVSVDCTTVAAPTATSTSDPGCFFPSTPLPTMPSERGLSGAVCTLSCCLLGNVQYRTRYINAFDCETNPSHSHGHFQHGGTSL